MEGKNCHLSLLGFFWPSKSHCNEIKWTEAQVKIGKKLLITIICLFLVIVQALQTIFVGPVMEEITF